MRQFREGSGAGLLGQGLPGRVPVRRSMGPRRPTSLWSIPQPFQPSPTPCGLGQCSHRLPVGSPRSLSNLHLRSRLPPSLSRRVLLASFLPSPCGSYPILPATHLSHTLSRSCGTILPTSLNHITPVDQRIPTLRPCCGYSVRFGIELVILVITSLFKAFPSRQRH